MRKRKSFGKWNKIFLTEWKNVDKCDKWLTNIFSKYFISMNLGVQVLTLQYMMWIKDDFPLKRGHLWLSTYEASYDCRFALKVFQVSFI